MALDLLLRQHQSLVTEHFFQLVLEGEVLVGDLLETVGLLSHLFEVLVDYFNLFLQLLALITLLIPRLPVSRHSYCRCIFEAQHRHSCLLGTSLNSTISLRHRRRS